MKYEWEDMLTDIAEIAANATDEIDIDGIQVVGIAVANFDTGEAAFLTPYKAEDLSDVVWSDFLKDVAGDADAIYGASVDAKKKVVN